jgi:cholesterol transport system auxiliary component
MSRDLLKSLGSAAAAALLLAACAFGSNRAAAPLVFDLGADPGVAATPLQPVDLQLVEISAPPWLATPGIAYRLAYLNEFQTHYYRDSRWLAPPAALLSERLRQQLAQGARANPDKPIPLRLELVQFEQRFSSPTQSEVRVSLRARLGEGPTLNQSFELVKPCGSADAAGAVQAFSAAADQLLAQVQAWAALNNKP